MKGLALTVALACSACGSNRPEIPPELLVPSNGCGGAAYPEGPYGAEPGDRAEDVCFEGFRSPHTAIIREDALEELSLSRYYDPEGERYELVLLNTAALWCLACRVEHETLPSRAAEFEDDGLVILSALFQDEAGSPADFDDLRVWIQTFEPNFPMALDPDYQLGRYASADTAPLNLLIDARNLEIIEKFVGNQESALWARIEQELSAR
jgi:hypothetical protein